MTGAKAASAMVAALPLLGLCTVLLVVAGAGRTAAPAPTVCGPGGSGQTIAGVRLDAEQMADARTVVAVTASRHLPPYAAVIALATAYTEAALRNPQVATDHDSRGLFQQRVSIYSQPVADDAVRATNAFLDRLVAIPRWPTAPVGVDAQTVQRSAYPARYPPTAALVRQLVGQLWPAAAAVAAAVNPMPVSRAVPAVCPGGGGVLPAGLAGAGNTLGPTGNTVAGTTTIPPGLVLDGSARGDRAVTYALAQLGKPYVFGAAGPGAFDCSGLTMAAWAAAGVALPHLAAAQTRAGRPEPTNLSQAVSGDLVMIPGSDGTAAQPGHVGIIAGYLDTHGSRHTYLIQAPMSGLPVELTPAAEWAAQIVAVRHIG